MELYHSYHYPKNSFLALHLFQHRMMLQHPCFSTVLVLQIRDFQSKEALMLMAARKMPVLAG